jgi:iron complex transport system ATP-binding protein
VFGETDWREVRKRVGLVTNTLTTFLESDEPAVHAVASGREAMLNVWGSPSKKLIKEAERLMNDLGCLHLRDSLWGVLSQGEKQKILICRALMAKFKMLILDEPCAGLDPVARDRFLRWLQSLGARPDAPTLVMVTHHVEEILPCITHVLMLKDGTVFAAGAKSQTLTSARLGAVYGAKVKLSCRAGRYRLELID